MIYLSGLSQEREFQTEIVITSVEIIGGENDVSFTLNSVTSVGIFPKTKMAIQCGVVTCPLYRITPAHQDLPLPPGQPRVPKGSLA